MEQSRQEENPRASMEPGRPLSEVVIFEMVVQDYSCDVLQPELANPREKPTEEPGTGESARNEQRGGSPEPSSGDSSDLESADGKSDEEGPTAAPSQEENAPERSSDLEGSPSSKPEETELQEAECGSSEEQDPGSDGEQNPAQGASDEEHNPARGVRDGSESSDSSSKKDNQPPAAASEETTPDPEKQVQAFTTEKELFPLLGHLKRIPLAELREDSDLENGYIGGKVLAQCLQDASQGSIEILVTDDSLSPRHVTCYLEGDITNLYPQQSGMEYQLYLHRVEVDNMFVEYSQDFELCVNVRGEEPRLWVVHRDARLRSFLPGGNRRKNRKKRKRKKRVVAEVGVDWKAWAELNRPRTEGGEGVERPPQTEGAEEDERPHPDTEIVKEAKRPRTEGVEEAERTAGDHEQQDQTNSTTDDAPAEAAHSGAAKDTAHPDPDGDSPSPEKSKDCQSSGQQSSFPDNFDLPESALRDYHTDDEEMPSGDEISSSSSFSESESEDSSTDEHDEVWEPKSKRPKIGDTGRQYEYKKIADLEVNDKRMNIFGVVSDFKAPFQTRGVDYCCFMTIVDESCPNAGIKCVLFHRNQDKLPQIKSVGDIVCLHRVNITERNSSPSVEGTPFSSYLCFDSKPNSKLKPRTGSFSYTFMSQDKARVKELRQWAAEQNFGGQNQTGGQELSAGRNQGNEGKAGAEEVRRLTSEREGSQLTCRLESVVPNSSFDLTCQVISITPYLPQCCASVLTVWDGTKLPLRNRKIDMSAYRCVSDPGLQHAAGVLAENVVVYDKSVIDAATLVKPGQFVAIRCIRAAMLQSGDGGSSPLVELCIPRDCSFGNACVKVLAVDDPNVVKLKEEMPSQPLLYSIDSSINNPPSVTTTLHPTVPLMPLNQICSWEVVPSKFRCRVIVSVISPSSVEEMVKLVCHNCGLVAPVPHQLDSNASRIPCPECNELDLSDPDDPPALCYTYFFKLLIEDSTGKLVVFVSEGDAVTLLPGLPPANLYRDQQLRYKLLDRLYYLTGGNSPFSAEPSARPRPWVECCILSYRHQPRNHSNNVLYYRIFDTILNDPQSL